MDIIAENISDNADYRKSIRERTAARGNLISTAKDPEAESVYEMYYDFSSPVSKMTPKFIPKPNNTTAVCRMILEVHLIPGAALPFAFQNIVIIIPARIEITAPPITGNCFPNNHDGIAITKHTSMPYIFLLNYK